MLEPNKVTKRKMVDEWILNHGEWLVLVNNKKKKKHF